ncbi:hypothetical protein LNP26_24985 [Klebsiella variicola subsp. variicola]|nr:hypothetical protein [Klebsiella variicola subsp. variicola]
MPPPVSRDCASWGTKWKCWLISAKRWATPAPLSAIPTRLLEGATDPRSNGAAAGY